MKSKENVALNILKKCIEKSQKQILLHLLSNHVRYYFDKHDR